MIQTNGIERARTRTGSRDASARGCAISQAAAPPAWVMAG